MMSKYRHLVGGEAYGIPHSVGDIVNIPNILPSKIQEWLEAGVIERVKESRKVVEDHVRTERTPEAEDAIQE